jgi:hypothetical protein
MAHEFLAIGLYAAVLVAIGVLAARRTRTLRDYYAGELAPALVVSSLAILVASRLDAAGARPGGTRADLAFAASREPSSA